MSGISELHKKQERAKAEVADGNATSFRCMVYKDQVHGFIAECVDLDLIVRGKTADGAKMKLDEALTGYLHVAYEGDVTGLVPRPSPLMHRLRYQFFSWLAKLNRTGTSFYQFNYPRRTLDRKAG